MVVWIGGVAFVTTVPLPSVRRIAAPAERVALFEAIERRFAWQARGATLLVGGTGFWMLELLDAWGRYRSLGFWWLHAMTAVWVLFTATPSCWAARPGIAPPGTCENRPRANLRPGRRRCIARC